MSLGTWIAYAATVSILVLMPGPSVLLAATRALDHGLAKAAATLAGDVSANVLQMLAAAMGLGALVAGNPASLEVLRWLGVAYLAYLGARQFRLPDHSVRSPAGGQDLDRRSSRVLYLEAFGVSLSNPKAIVFFAALFPAFLASDRPIGPQLLILGLTFVALDLSAMALWASAAQRLGRLRKRYLARVSGVLLMAASLGLAIK